MEREAVERVAAAMMAHDDQTSLAEGMRLLLLGKGQEHSGDCLKQPWSCMRCIYDDETAKARAAIAQVMAILGEPTEAMLVAPYEAEIDFGPGGTGDIQASPENVWRSMLAASPLSQGGQADG